MWDGRLGWQPTNGSFLDFVAALRIILSEDGAREWVSGIQANHPKVYGLQGQEDDTVEAGAAGEVDAGFVNSYFLPELRSRGSEPGKVVGKYFTDGDPGAVIHVSIGAGVLGTARNIPAAERLIEFLFEDESQRGLPRGLRTPPCQRRC